MNYVIIDEIIKRAFEEDFPYGDITTETLIDKDAELEAVLIAKETGVIAGLPVLERVYTLLGGVSVNALCSDGQTVQKGDRLVELRGNAVNLLKGERTALNLIQRLSGIATMTNRYTQVLKGSKTKLWDTRKTTPGLRYLEKYAVTIGGGQNHRFGLSDGILIKDNHIAAVGSIRSAVELARQRHGFTRKIEVETETLDMVQEALEANADIIMLDNMDNDTMKKAVLLINGRALSECSGNVTLERLESLAETGVDYVSCGALTHSFSSLDISLRIV